MDRHIKIGLMDADDGVSVVVYGKPSWLYGPWERRFSSLLDAYRAISEEIPGIAFHEVAALYKPKGADVMSRPPGDQKDWAAFFGHTIP